MIAGKHTVGAGVLIEPLLVPGCRLTMLSDQGLATQCFHDGYQGVE